MNQNGTAFFIRAEIGVREHGDDRLVVEKFYGVGTQTCNVVERVGVGISIDEGVGHVQHATFGADNVYGGKMVVWLTDSDDFLRNFNGIGPFGIKSRNECVGIA